MIENGCCLIHFGVLKETRTFGGDLGGGGGGGGGGGEGGWADVQRQLDGVLRNKLIYQRITVTGILVLKYFGPGRKFSLKFWSARTDNFEKYGPP